MGGCLGEVVLGNASSVAFIDWLAAVLDLGPRVLFLLSKSSATEQHQLYILENLKAGPER